MHGEHLRLFLAIPLPPKIQKQLARRLKALHVKKVHQHPTQQLHLTIHFYGLILEDNLPQLIRQVEETLLGSSDLSLLVNHVGLFPDTKRPRSLWYGVSGDVARLGAMASKFQTINDPQFIGHITIGTIDRQAKLSERAAIKEKFLKVRFRKPLFFQANEVILYRSKLTHSNPIYTKIASFSLV